MLRLMIVDDDANIREGLSLIIRDHVTWPYAISEAENGQAALDKIVMDRVDVLITDIKMPLINGVDLLEKVKEARRDCEVIMLSGFDDYSYMRSALKLGAFDYLLKPVNVPTFLKVLENARKNCIGGKKIKQNRRISPSRSPDDSHIAFYDRPAEKYEGFSPDSGLEAALEYAAALQKQKALKELRRFLAACSPDNMEEVGLRGILTQWIYTLMQRNNNYIEIVGSYKLTDFDVLNCVKNLPTISQLSARFLEIMDRYMGDLIERETNSKSSFLRSVTDFLNENYSGDVSLEAVSKHLYMHPNYFSTVFKAKNGVSFRDFRRTYIMQKAKSMLQDKKVGIGEIGSLLGYQDVSHFIRAFKSSTGLTPSQYRKDLGK